MHKCTQEVCFSDFIDSSFSGVFIIHQMMKCDLGQCGSRNRCQVVVGVGREEGTGEMRRRKGEGERVGVLRSWNPLVACSPLLARSFPARSPITNLHPRSVRSLREKVK